MNNADRVLVQAWSWETAPAAVREQAPFRAEWLVLIETPMEIPPEALLIAPGQDATKLPLPDGRILLIGGARK